MSSKHADEDKVTPLQEWRAPALPHRWYQQRHAVTHVGAPRAFKRYALIIKSVHSGGTVQLGRVAFQDARGQLLPYTTLSINESRAHGDGAESYHNLQNDDRRKWCAELSWFPSQTPRIEFVLRSMSRSLHSCSPRPTTSRSATRRVLRSRDWARPQERSCRHTRGP